MPEQIKKMTEDENIIKLLFILALPAVISGLVDTFYNTVDSIFVGQYVGSKALAALSVINVIQLMYVAIGVLFSVGNASIISRALGAQHPERAVSSLIHSFWAAFFVSNIISFSILMNLDSFLTLIGASEESLPYARDYGSIILLTGFILPINNLLLGAFRAKGQAISATYLNIIGAVINIGLDALFIISFGWGVAGAALATAIGQGVVFVIAVRRIMKLYNTNLLFHNKSEISTPLLKEIVHVGTPTGLRLILFAGAFSIANVILKPYGDNYLSAFGIFNRLIMLMSMINISLGIGSQPLIGVNYGAKLYKRVERIIFKTFSVGLVISILTCIFLWYSPASVFGIFTSDLDIIRICREISMPQAYTYIGWGIFICIAEALQAMGHAKESFWLSLLYPISVIFGFVVFDKLWGLQGVYWAFPFSYLVIGIVASVMLIKELRSLNQKQENLKNAF